MRVNRSFLAGIFLGAIATGTAVYFLANPRSATRPPESIEWRPAEHILPDSFLAVQQAGLLSNLLDLIDADLQDDPQRTLTPETIDRISAFCYGARPYLTVDADSLGAGPYSPERGQLLLVLARMNLDSASWSTVKARATFARAFLPGATLSHTDLRHADLRSAWLRDAELRDARLAFANLEYASLWGADLKGANMIDIKLRFSDLSWAVLEDADLASADLSGASLVSSRLDRANLRGARIEWADARYAMIRHADLVNARIGGLDLTNAQLDMSRLDSADLLEATLIQTRLAGCSLQGAYVGRAIIAQRDWFGLLESFHATGVDDLRTRFHIIQLGTDDPPRYRLEKITR